MIDFGETSRSAWSSTTLGEFTSKKRKSIEPAKTPDLIFELYSIPAHPSGKPEVIQGSEIGSSKQLVEESEILLSKINPRINRVWIVGSFTSHPQIASTEWIVFQPGAKVAPKFLSYYLQLDTLRDFLSTNASGVGGSLMRVKSSTLEAYPFAYPELSIQSVITDHLDLQVTRIESGIASLRRAKQKLAQYRASVLKAACEGRLVPTEAELARQEGRDYETGSQLLNRILETRRKSWNGKGKYKEAISPEETDSITVPEGWSVATADQLTSIITDGEHITPRRSESGNLLLSARNVQDGKLSLKNVDYVPDDEFERIQKRLVVQAGDVLLSCSGSVGRSTVVPPNIAFTLVRSVAVLKPLFDMGPILSYMLRSPQLKAQIIKAQTQTAQANIFQGSIKKLSFPLPPLAEQIRIVAEVERRLSVIDQLETTVTANLQRASRLRQSILQTAFNPSSRVTNI